MTALEVKKLSEPGMYAVGTVAGLQLVIGKGSGRSWILRTKVGTKRKDIGLGSCPACRRRSNIAPFGGTLWVMDNITVGNSFGNFP